MQIFDSDLIEEEVVLDENTKMMLIQRGLGVGLINNVVIDK